MFRRRSPDERMRRVLWKAGWTLAEDGWVDDGGGQEVWTSQPHEFGMHRCVLTWALSNGYAEAEISQWTYGGMRIRLAYTDGDLGRLLLGVAADDLGYVLSENVGGPFAGWLGRIIGKRTKEAG